MIKKWEIILILLLLPFGAFAETTYPTNQITVAWDAVTKLADGTAIPAGDIVKYQPYTKYGVTTATPQKVEGEITATQKLISFTVEGKYYFCVQAIRYKSGDPTPITDSKLSCSDVVADTQGGNTFSAVYYIPLMPATGLRKP